MSEQAAKWKYEQKTTEEGQAPIVHSMNPQLTMGENLADLGGMSLAAQALEKRLVAAGVDGESQKQLFRLFYLSWANVWKSKATEADIIKSEI